MTADNGPTVFISYARADHEGEGRSPDSFVQKLYEALKAGGFTPWLDHHDLPSRGTPFPKEIQIAIQKSERLVAVCGSEYPNSDWGRAEYEYANKLCTPIVPVLFKGTFEDSLPPEIKMYNAINMCGDFDTCWPVLLKRLQEEVKPLGMLLNSSEFQMIPGGALPRNELIKHVIDALRPDDSLPVVIDGKSGIHASSTTLHAAGGLGKSTLAAMIARDCDLRRGFPDGILWVRIGPNIKQVDEARVKIGVLLGGDYEELSGPNGAIVYNNLLREKDILIVLDDVWCREAVEDCLIQGSKVRFLITTRNQQIGRDLNLPKANRVSMDYLSDEEGARLIAGALGINFTGDYPYKDVHLQIAHELEGHTQAIAIAAGRLQPIKEGGQGADYAPDLLAEFRQGDSALFEALRRDIEDESREGNLLKSLSLSYEALSEVMQQHFRQLSVIAPGATFEVKAAAAVWDMQESRAIQVLALLVGRALIIPLENGRFSLHALVHATMRVIAEQKGEAGEHEEAFTRYAEYVITLAQGFSLSSEEWIVLEPELPHVDYIGNELAARYEQNSDDEDLRQRVGEFAYRVHRYVHRRRQAVRTAAGITLRGLNWLEMGLATVRQNEDKKREALFLNEIGVAWDSLGEKRKALEYYEQTLEIDRTVGDRVGEASTLNNIGKVWDDLGERRKALEYHVQALSLIRTTGDQGREASTLNSIGKVLRTLGDARKALEFYEQALPLRRAVGDQGGEALTLNNIGMAWSALGEKRKAIEFHEQALLLSRAVGDRVVEAFTLNSIGCTWYMLGEQRRALEYLEQALSLRRVVGDRGGEALTCGNIGVIYRDLGDLDQAIEYVEHCIQLMTEIEHPELEINCQMLELLRRERDQR